MAVAVAVAVAVTGTWRAAQVWFVIPAFCESQVIATTLKHVIAAFPNIVVIDDGSSDDTGSKALRAGAAVVTHPINLGQGAAIQTGIDFALSQGAEYIVTFDADGQHIVADVQRMLDTLIEKSSDAVLGSRFLGGTENLPPLRKMILKLAVSFTNFTSGIKLTDAHNGLRVFNCRAASRLCIEQNGMAHASEIIDQIGRLKLRIEEVPVTVLYTEYSLKKGQKLSNSFRILSDIILGWIYR